MPSKRMIDVQHDEEKEDTKAYTIEFPVPQYWINTSYQVRFYLTRMLVKAMEVSGPGGNFPSDM
ncbi:hypothetical protein OSB04_007441 [Centaurea solstitialis]|uniref:Uncharacterized protein n=1 Tax=Centaurea solstitialis TaxID=347529 RepID=A0AA38WT97_9ASTR|nr:hypothetical protein OSB04_007441 [Centaurea solstitialis]